MLKHYNFNYTGSQFYFCVESGTVIIFNLRTQESLHPQKYRVVAVATNIGTDSTGTLQDIYLS